MKGYTARMCVCKEGGKSTLRTGQNRAGREEWLGVYKSWDRDKWVTDLVGVEKTAKKEKNYNHVCNLGKPARLLSPQSDTLAAPARRAPSPARARPYPLRRGTARCVCVLGSGGPERGRSSLLGRQPGARGFVPARGPRVAERRAAAGGGAA